MRRAAVMSEPDNGPDLASVADAVDGAVAEIEPVAQARRMLRVNSVFNLSAIVLYLAGGAFATATTYLLAYEDWVFYALMSLCSAIVLTAYGRLKPRTGWLRRFATWLFAELVVLAWTALLFEKTLGGWTVVGNSVVEHGPQPVFWLPVLCNLSCAALMAFHFLVIAPQTRRKYLANSGAVR